VPTAKFIKTTLVLILLLLFLASLAYFLYNTFREKPLDISLPYLKEEQDTDLLLQKEEVTDPLSEEANINSLFGVSNCQATPDTLEAEDMLSKVNTYRAQNGVGPLKLSPTLMKAAAWFADDLLARDERGHIDGLGRDPSKRALDCGYPVQTVAENVAGGTLSDPFAWWKQSQGHNANLIHPSMKVMGYGIANSGGIYRYVWIAGTQDDSASQPTPQPSPTGQNPSPTSTLPSPQPTPELEPCNSESRYFFVDLRPKSGVATNYKGQVRLEYDTELTKEWDPEKNAVAEMTTNIPQSKVTNVKLGGTTSSVNIFNTTFFQKTFDISTQLITDIRQGKGYYQIETTQYPDGELYGEVKCQAKEDNSDGDTPSPTSIPSPTATLAPGTKALDLSFDFPGIGQGENSAPVYQQKNIHIQIFNSENNLVTEDDISAGFTRGSYRNTYVLPNITGIHYIKARANNSLTANSEPEVVNIDNRQQYPLNFSFISGDLNQDNTLDIRDYNLFLAKFVACFLVPNCGEVELIDFDANGTVDLVDFNILLRSFQEVKGSE